MDEGKCGEFMVTVRLAHDGQMDLWLSSDYLIIVNMRDEGIVFTFSACFLSNTPL